jgi:uncharacterized protein YegL
MFTQSPSHNAATFQGQQGGGPIIAGVPDDARPLKVYGDELIMFLADNSGSMSGPKAVEASQAISVCLNELADPSNKDGFRVSVLTYASSSQLLHSASEPMKAITTLDGNGGGTSLAPAICLAQAEVTKYSVRPNRRLQPAVAIIFSDGQLGDGPQAEIEASRLKAMGVKVITIGFGADADEAQLRRLASAPDHYAFANVGQLKPLFALVGKTLSQQNRNP